MKDNRIYTDCSGDACPPDGRYDRALNVVLGIIPESNHTANELAGKMCAINESITGFANELEWESCLETIRMRGAK